MVHRKVFDKIGLVDEDFGVGSQEDIAFCAAAELAGFELVEPAPMIWTEEAKTHVGAFPIYHMGEGTVHDASLVPDWDDIFHNNEILLAKKFNPKMYEKYMKRHAPEKPAHDQLTGGGKKKYSIVIPTYNHCDDLLKPCIETLLKYNDVWDIELIISANGCTDNTKQYLEELQHKYQMLGLVDNLKVVWNDQPLGYARAVNAGVRVSTSDLVVLLNNDVVTIDQPRNTWLEILEKQFKINSKCGISCIFKLWSDIPQRAFAVFFCVMIHRTVFNTIGLLNEEYEVGGCEDAEFSLMAEDAGFEVCESVEKSESDDPSVFTGYFPIFHRGEGTMKDTDLVPSIQSVRDKNSLILAKKYNPTLYAALTSTVKKPNPFIADRTHNGTLGRIEVYTVAWNEEDSIDQFIDWYSFADSITVYDNRSTDKTREKALARGCNVHIYGSEQQDNRLMLTVKENCWRDSTAEWVIICDMDEFLYHPNLLQVLETTSASIVRCAEYGMVSEEEVPRSEVKTGVRVQPPDKIVCFRPDRIKAMNWLHGCHVCYPEGDIKFSDETATLLHYAMVGRNAVKKRWIEYKKRMCDWDIENGAGKHYLWEETQIDVEFDRHLREAVKVW